MSELIQLGFHFVQLVLTRQKIKVILQPFQPYSQAVNGNGRGLFWQLVIILGVCVNRK